MPWPAVAGNVAGDVARGLSCLASPVQNMVGLLAKACECPVFMASSSLLGDHPLNLRRVL